MAKALEKRNERFEMIRFLRVRRQQTGGLDAPSASSAPNPDRVLRPLLPEGATGLQYGMLNADRLNRSWTQPLHGGLAAPRASALDTRRDWHEYRDLINISSEIDRP
jgi:hypothetical protein